MKIGIDARSLLIKQKEGMHVYADNIIRQLIALYPNNYYILFLDKPVPKNIVDQFSKNVKFMSLRPPFFWPQTRLTLHFLINRAKDVDVFFFPTQSMSLWCPKKTLAVIHDVAYLKFPEYFTTWNRFVLSKLTTNFTVCLANKLICISEQTKKDIIKLYSVPAEKITVIYHGYDPKIFYPRNNREIENVRQKYQIKQKYLAFLGTLQKRKNIVRLIQAYDQLKKTRNLTHQLVIMGKKGWLYEDIFKQVRQLGLQSNVIFTDYLPIDDAATLLSGADAYVIPSLYEGFGIPVIEAMACGAPVIISNVSALPEIAGRAAQLINNPYEIKDIAQSIWYVIENNEYRAKLRSAGLKRASDFSWKKCAEQTLSVIKSLSD